MAWTVDHVSSWDENRVCRGTLESRVGNPSCFTTAASTLAPVLAPAPGIGWNASIRTEPQAAVVSTVDETSPSPNFHTLSSVSAATSAANLWRQPTHGRDLSGAMQLGVLHQPLEIVSLNPSKDPPVVFSPDHYSPITAPRPHRLPTLSPGA